MYYFHTKTLMIYVNHPVYDLHDAPNPLFLNINIYVYSCDLNLCVHFFIPVINTSCSKKHFHWIIFKNIYIFFNYNLNF